MGLQKPAWEIIPKGVCKLYSWEPVHKIQEALVGKLMPHLLLNGRMTGPLLAFFLLILQI